MNDRYVLSLNLATHSRPLKERTNTIYFIVLLFSLQFFQYGLKTGRLMLVGLVIISLSGCNSLIFRQKNLVADACGVGYYYCGVVTTCTNSRNILGRMFGARLTKVTY